MSEPYPSRAAREIEDLGFARLDLQRAVRTGDPEVVFGEGKTPEQVVALMRALHRAHPAGAVLATRLTAEAMARCRAELPGADTDEVARVAVLGEPMPSRGRVAVVGAGTSDLPVIRECAATIRVFGSAPDIIVDVGVAGLHRLLAERDRIDTADIVVAVAGMEAALPSVLGGLTGTPLIAVPTSVGYGWHLDGLTAWLAVLNSCAPGVVTVNIDNGFGAGVAAARIARRIGQTASGPAAADMAGHDVTAGADAR
ncbi:MAG TPA: nickel pincer cofactor biosynthesis protein LarB [Pilimelia sp.]|nr:nickel pincer cofactor biosynthesis protein LarB [Pilimelia sp.]